MDFPQTPFIQALAQGYIGFLGIKNGGSPPLAAGNQLAPTMDMMDWYRAGLRTWNDGAQILTGVGTPTYYVLGGPSKQVVIIERYTALLVTDAAATGVIMYPAKQNPVQKASGEPARAMLLSSLPIRMTTPLTVETLFVSADRPFILNPGETFGVIIHQGALAAGNRMFGDWEGVAVSS